MCVCVCVFGGGGGATKDRTHAFYTRLKYNGEKGVGLGLGVNDGRVNLE